MTARTGALLLFLCILCIWEKGDHGIVPKGNSTCEFILDVVDFSLCRSLFVPIEL